MNTKIAVKVVGKVREAEDIVSFELERIDGQPLPPFSAGAHIDVQVTPDIVRQYSLCNQANETHRYLIAVLREPASRGGSVAMHDQVGVGDVLTISEPKNHFPMVQAPHSVLFAGGIGVTPILCMAERLSNTGAAFEMHYAARAPERMAFRKRIEASPFSSQVQQYFDSIPQRKLDVGQILTQAPANAAIYVCGPAGFIDHVMTVAQECGVASDRIHTEYFGAVQQHHADDGSFEVQLASSGATFSVPPEKSVLQVLLDHGVDVPYSCEQGVCGTCVTRVLQGTPEHRDFFLSDEERAENDQFMPCCSRAKGGRLVIDL